MTGQDALDIPVAKAAANGNFHRLVAVSMRSGGFFGVGQPRPAEYASKKGLDQRNAAV